MKNLAEILKNETNTITIFTIIEERSNELVKLHRDTDHLSINYMNFTVEELEDVTFIRAFERYMCVMIHELSLNMSIHIAEDEVARLIDDAREAKGLSPEIIAARANTWQSELPCALAYLIKTGREIRRWLRTPRLAVAS